MTVVMANTAHHSLDLRQTVNLQALGIRANMEGAVTKCLSMAVCILSFHVSQTMTNKVPVQHPSYPYPPPIETQWPSANGFLSFPTLAESTSWRNALSTANSAYGSGSNVSGGHTRAAMIMSSTMSYGHQDSHWGQQPPFQPPTRLMSYDNIEGLPQQYFGQGLGI
ncbi:hypothetical protein IG631_22449 [Alternaria alternata]|nr:hypothetical protein IG631_22449 [Alternaria alternata]